jgi:hypothetical protein
MKSVPTPQGEVELLDPPVDLVREICRLLPFGGFRLVPPQRGADFGLVMQCGDRELSAVKLQGVDTDEETGELIGKANSFLLAHSLAAYLGAGFSGLFLPCVYVRPKTAGRVESGLAFFGFPDPEGLEYREASDEPVFDEALGRGFTKMMLSFSGALTQSSRDTGLKLQQVIGVDIRKRLQLGSLWFGFMAVGVRIVCLKPTISEGDPIWRALRSTGVSAVFHLPSITIAIKDDDLPQAKAGESG